MEELKLNINDIARLKSNNLSLEEKAELIKCSKPHITNLPYDLRTTDLNKLRERLNVIESEIKKREQRIGVLEGNIRSEERQLNKDMSDTSSALSNLKELYTHDVNLDETQTYTNTQLLMETNGRFINIHFNRGKEAYEEVSSQYDELSKQLDNYYKTGKPIDEKLLDDYVENCNQLYIHTGLLNGLGYVIDENSDYLVNERYSSAPFDKDSTTIDNRSGFIRGHYKWHKDYTQNLNEEQEIVDDLYNEGFRTNEKMNEVRGFYDRDEQGDGLL